ncbi:dihydrolipoamide acyltransferase [Amycolatopsis acidicola]|uniref:Dihydrolipoamide acyltransferase n=1 Tax=Amycolatopsis acidicola TaxID=2596893 RepID=A0A5N0VCE8_9PSEU|nr:biotin/lipoyl-containing protein [Amycolatopsis acidicola]KAA9164057.1 dihydrolipoamide acyltransferase [Amycolatopsis acidicola]
MQEIRIPQASMEMTEGSIETWHVENGAAVKEGETLYSLETDKVVMDVESPAAGIIKIIGEPGTSYAVGDLIATIE